MILKILKKTKKKTKDLSYEKENDMKNDMTKAKIKNISLRDYVESRYKTKEQKEGLEKERLLARIALSIAESREKQGLSQARMAKLLHTKQQYISRIEQPENDSNITLRTLSNIADVLHKKLVVELV